MNNQFPDSKDPNNPKVNHLEVPTPPGANGMSGEFVEGGQPAGMQPDSSPESTGSALKTAGIKDDLQQKRADKVQIDATREEIGKQTHDTGDSSDESDGKTPESDELINKVNDFLRPDIELRKKELDEERQKHDAAQEQAQQAVQNKGFFDRLFGKREPSNVDGEALRQAEQNLAGYDTMVAAFREGNTEPLVDYTQKYLADIIQLTEDPYYSGSRFHEKADGRRVNMALDILREANPQKAKFIEGRFREEGIFMENGRIMHSGAVQANRSRSQELVENIHRGQSFLRNQFVLPFDGRIDPRQPDDHTERKEVEARIGKDMTELESVSPRLAEAMKRSAQKERARGMNLPEDSTL